MAVRKDPEAFGLRLIEGEGGAAASKDAAGVAAQVAEPVGEAVSATDALGDVVEPPISSPRSSSATRAPFGSSAANNAALDGSAADGSAADGTAERRTSRELDDAELVALARVGDRAAFEKLYRRHSGYALALAVRVQGHAGDVEDIVHDAFLRANDRLDALRSDDAFRGWLGTLVVNLVRTRLRRRKLLLSLGLATSEPIDLDALAVADAGPEVRAQLAQVYTALRQLPVDQRIAWTLRYVQGHKLEDVADMAGCSLATAKRWIVAAQRHILAQGPGTQGGVDV